MLTCLHVCQCASIMSVLRQIAQATRGAAVGGACVGVLYYTLSSQLYQTTKDSQATLTKIHRVLHSYSQPPGMSDAASTATSAPKPSLVPSPIQQLKNRWNAAVASIPSAVVDTSSGEEQFVVTTWLHKAGAAVNSWFQDFSKSPTPPGSKEGESESTAPAIVLMPLSKLARYDVVRVADADYMLMEACADGMIAMPLASTQPPTLITSSEATVFPYDTQAVLLTSTGQ
eukprot:m.15687 g.15687  ORF g.15687 m.15687 type:complete len:229 (-) comp6708_c0_seq1:98-784(-)